MHGEVESAVKNQEHSCVSSSSFELRGEIQAGDGNIRVLRKAMVFRARDQMRSPREGVDREERSCSERRSGNSKGWGCGLGGVAGWVGVGAGGGRTWSLRPAEEGGR